MWTRNGLSGLLAATVASAAVMVAWPLVTLQAKTGVNTDPATIASEFCVTSAVEARASLDDRIDRHYSVDVPIETPPMGFAPAVVHSIAKGEVVQFDVASPRPGKIAVHGLLDAETVQVGSILKVAFRAVYTGRFPLHFHGADGSHFEIAALEVLPKSMIAARSNDR